MAFAHSISPLSPIHIGLASNTRGEPYVYRGKALGLLGVYR